MRGQIAVRHEEAAAAAAEVELDVDVDVETPGWILGLMGAV